MQTLLTIRDGPISKPTLEQKIMRAQQKVRRRAEERWEKYIKEMPRLTADGDLQSHSEELVIKKVQNLKPPVHPELNIRNVSEVEIFHEINNFEKDSYDQSKTVANPNYTVKEHDDIDAGKVFSGENFDNLEQSGTINNSENEIKQNNIDDVNNDVRNKGNVDSFVNVGNILPNNLDRTKTIINSDTGSKQDNIDNVVLNKLKVECTEFILNEQNNHLEINKKEVILKGDVYAPNGSNILTTMGDTNDSAEQNKENTNQVLDHKVADGNSLCELDLIDQDNKETAEHNNVNSDKALSFNTNEDALETIAISRYEQIAIINQNNDFFSTETENTGVMNCYPPEEIDDKDKSDKNSSLTLNTEQYNFDDDIKKIGHKTVITEKEIEDVKEEQKNITKINVIDLSDNSIIDPILSEDINKVSIDTIITEVKEKLNDIQATNQFLESNNKSFDNLSQEFIKENITESENIKLGDIGREVKEMEILSENKYDIANDNKLKEETEIDYDTKDNTKLENNLEKDNNNIEEKYEQSTNYVINENILKEQIDNIYETSNNVIKSDINNRREKPDIHIITDSKPLVENDINNDEKFTSVAKNKDISITTTQIPIEYLSLKEENKQDDIPTSRNADSLQKEFNILIVNADNKNEIKSITSGDSTDKNNSNIDLKPAVSQNGDNLNENIANPSGMDLETAAITIQKVFRSFLFKSRTSTLDDTNDENNSLEEDDNKTEQLDYQVINGNKERRGITRMDTVLQTVNEEKSLSLSTDDSSLSSAATTIQAHVRGFLVRNRLHSNKTSTNSLANSDGTSTISLDGDVENNKNKTILNIHIVPEGGNFLSRDETILTSMDISLDSSPPSSLNLHPLGYDRNERKQLKREDAIQSISPPSNNSGKLSEDVDSVKEMIINVGELSLTQNNLQKNMTHSEENKIQSQASDISPIDSTIIETLVGTQNPRNIDNADSPQLKSQITVEKPRGILTKMSSDEMDVVTPFQENPEGNPFADSSASPKLIKNSEDSPLTDTNAASKLMHSSEFHDIVLPTKVSRSDTSVVSGE
ncbi:uncharacterized protein PF3D7_1120600-like isoform X1 [Achroia grisella]|uniref:uncharacterized protein PF3D7_1120600-like isoform X1 n=1 Tax=Achroia grisella TaxID=688607 RepID=UPI0027D2A0FB|nr:uncharacterized protein PF3D7_1120600-like isoform X1 [Achroia grisella]